MSRLERGPVTTDTDQRIQNLITAWTYGVEHGDAYAADMLWVLENWKNARKALKEAQTLTLAGGTLRQLLDAGLAVVGE